jgi:hypothetical protein
VPDCQLSAFKRALGPLIAFDFQTVRIDILSLFPQIAASATFREHHETRATAWPRGNPLA